MGFFLGQLAFFWEGIKTALYLAFLWKYSCQRNKNLKNDKYLD